MILYLLRVRLRQCACPLVRRSLGRLFLTSNDGLAESELRFRAFPWLRRKRAVSGLCPEGAIGLSQGFQPLDLALDQSALKVAPDPHGTIEFVS
jgi:hypothetical protein